MDKERGGIRLNRLNLVPKCPTRRANYFDTKLIIPDSNPTLYISIFQFVTHRRIQQAKIFENKHAVIHFEVKKMIMILKILKKKLDRALARNDHDTYRRRSTNSYR